MEVTMDIDNILNISHLYSVSKMSIVNHWINEFDKNKFNYEKLRDYWKHWVPKAFTPDHVSPNLDWIIKEAIVQMQLIDPIEEFICHGDPRTILNYVCDSYSLPSICGKVFKMGEPTYNCRDCGMDPTCVLCLNCFQLSKHKNHKYKMGTSGGGGCCDCGDIEAWKSDPYCTNHQQGLNKKRKNDLRFPQDFVERTRAAFSAILRYAYQVLTLEYSPGLPSDLKIREESDNPLSNDLADLYCTVLYNDETHTFEQVINTLARVIKCSHRDAIEYVTNIDREGRAVVKSASFHLCTELKIEIERFTSRHGTRPLKVLVVHSHVVAHQLFALRLLTWLQKIVGMAEGFRRIFAEIVLNSKHPDGSSGSLIESILMKDSLLWKSARLHWHRLLISAMFIEYENKKAFAKVFTKNYGAVLKDFIRDDHDHSFSIASLSIQIFPVPTLAQYLIAYEDVLFIMLNTFISECSRKCNRLGKLEFDRTAPTGPFKRATYILYDLRYLLGTPPTKWTDELRKGFLQGVSLILTLLTYMQGMDAVTRQVGQHLEYEPEWESAFNLHIKLAPVITLVLKWCSTDRIVLIKAYRLTLKKLYDNPSFDPNQAGVVRELADHSVSCLQYDVSVQPVSIHLPLSRFFAGLHLQLEKFGLNFDSPDFYHLTKQTPVQIIEPVLRTQVMIAQVHAGMWRRNGYSLSNQIFFYHNVKCRGEMLDKDIVLLQIGASLIESNEFLIHCLNRYGLINWAADDFETSSVKSSEEDTMKQTINMIEEFLSILIVITGERYVPGVGKVTQEDCVKNEIIHQLLIHELTHSELTKTLQDDGSSEAIMEKVINEVATYKKHNSGKGIYQINEAYLDRYNVFFYHYTKEEMSKSEEEQRKLRREKTGLECCPPPVLPPFSDSFNMVADLLQCDVMLHIMKIVLERSLNLRARSFSETQLHKILNLIGYALHEEEQKYSTFFQFTTRAEKWGLERLLKELSSSPRVIVHRDLINYTLKKFKQISSKASEILSTPGCSDGSHLIHESQEKQEKENRAKLAAQRRAQIMAQMAMQQKLFMKENAELFNETDTSDKADESNDVEMTTSNEQQLVCIGPNKTILGPETRKNVTVTCIICQETDVVRHDGPALVLAAFIQKSTVLCRTRSKFSETASTIDGCKTSFYLDSNLGPAPHASTCGHVMHSTCWSTYIDGILTRENRRPYRLRQPTSFDIEKNEYLCPLCYCLNNTVIPVIPDLNIIMSELEPSDETDAVSFTSWYDATVVALKQKRKIDEAVKSSASNEVYPVENFTGESREPTFVPAHDELSTLYESDAQSPYVSLLQGTMGLTANSDDEDMGADDLPNSDNRSSSPSSRASGPVNKFIPLSDGDMFMRLRIFMSRGETRDGRGEGEASSRPLPNISLEIMTMIQLFAQMAYTKGLDVNPHEDDPAVPMMAWKCCAYTVHSTEWLLRYTNKSLLGDFTCRQRDGLENLVRMCGLLGCVWRTKQIANKLGVRLLMMLIDNRSSDESLLEWDCFGLLVPLAGTLPSIYHEDNYPIPTGSQLDLHVLTVLLIAHMAQTLILSDLTEVIITESEEEVREDDTDEDTSILRTLIRILKNVHFVDTIALWAILKKSSIPFLRSSAIFYHFLTGIPAPRELKEPGGDTYENLCRYLGLPTSCNPLLGVPNVITLFISWAHHPKVGDLYTNVVQLRNMVPMNELVTLPEDYSELLNTVSLFTCPNSDREDSRNPTMCLVCGEMLCSQTYCCQTELNKLLVGACTYHTHVCGAGSGIFLRVRECEVLLLASPNRGCFLAPPYLDQYDEPDQGLRRGNPLHLSLERYRRLQVLWLSHSIYEEIARAIETANSLIPTQWQHL
ncbi:hypothetical protein O3M35_004459 [Rhynocoris fuscipes]|uniref:E3 ubiquitin-protein ligase n=1 Tax=Rhynocoris fuscipes TaxID=488301 RepID=A0AAW1CFR0_9HEMI